MLSFDEINRGREMDFTSHYHTATRKYIHGRLSLRKRNGKYEVYVYWFRLRKEEVLYSSDDLGGRGGICQRGDAQAWL